VHRRSVARAASGLVERAASDVVAATSVAVAVADAAHLSARGAVVSRGPGAGSLAAAAHRLVDDHDDPRVRGGRVDPDDRGAVADVLVRTRGAIAGIVPVPVRR